MGGKGGNILWGMGEEEERRKSCLEEIFRILSELEKAQC
jgi:hypothetical protein